MVIMRLYGLGSSGEYTESWKETGRETRRRVGIALKSRGQGVRATNCCSKNRTRRYPNMARGTFKIKGYTAYGRITGSCGHLHKSERAAEKCARLDKDKHVCAVDEDGYLWSDYGY